jgi:hypothetical protein
VPTSMPRARLRIAGGQLERTEMNFNAAMVRVRVSAA